MGRQFQLETIPRFQWRVIVEVCSGLAQTKLGSTNFWVIECDVRFGVKGAVLTVDQSLPIYPDKQTFSESDGMSQMCQQTFSESDGMSQMCQKRTQVGWFSPDLVKSFPGNIGS